MQKKSVEEFEYSPEDIKKLIFEDVCKHLRIPITKQNVDIWIQIGCEPSGEEYPQYVLQKIHVKANVTSNK
jgi:hypothetical protein